MKTLIGDYLRKLRLNEDETLRKMAENLEVSPAFLSAIENGKKKLPEKLLKTIVEKYKLNSDEAGMLKDAALESFGTIKLDLDGASNANRELAVSFARRFKILSEDKSSEILKILNN